MHQTENSRVHKGHLSVWLSQQELQTWLCHPSTDCKSSYKKTGSDVTLTTSHHWNIRGQRLISFNKGVNHPARKSSSFNSQYMHVWFILIIPIPNFSIY